MNNIQFSQSFRFYTFSFSRYHYTDNRPVWPTII